MRFYTLAQVATNNSEQVTVALITGSVSVLLAVLGIIGARFLTQPKIPKTDPDENRDKHESILATYTGDQNEFISLVMKDSKDVHARLDNFEGVVEQLRKERLLFVSAVGRYILKLTQAWGSGGKMPYPDTEDLSILEETLPADWRRRPR